MLQGEDEQGILLALNNLGNVARDQQDYPAAQSLFNESLEMGQETGDKYGTALSLASLGVVAWYQQDYESATSLLQQSLGLHHELGDNAGILNCAETLAKTAAQGKGDRAALLWGASAALREVAGAPLPPSDRVDYERVVATTRASVDTETFDSAWEEGRVLTLDQIMSVAFDPHRN